MESKGYLKEVVLRAIDSYCLRDAHQLSTAEGLTPGAMHRVSDYWSCG